MGLRREGVPLVPLQHPWVGTLMVEGIRTEEPLGGNSVGGSWGVQPGPGRLGKAVRERPRKFLIKTSPCYCQISPKTGTVGVSLASPLWKGCGRAGTGREKGSKAGPTCPASAGGQAARTRTLQLAEDTAEQDAAWICEIGKG